MSLNDSKNVLKRFANMIYENRLEYIWKFLKLNDVDKSCLFLALIVLLSNGSASLNVGGQKEPTITEVTLDDDYSAPNAIARGNYFEKRAQEAVKKLVDDSVNIIKESIRPEAIITQDFKITENELLEICALVAGEAGPNAYEEAWNVINTIYNRTKSIIWINEMRRALGDVDGSNIYIQATCPGQFTAYKSARYYEYYGLTDIPAYQAVIDFLLTKETKHDYLCFRSKEDTNPEHIQLVPGGNKYFSVLTEEDRVTEEKVQELKRQR